jgi:hypothetical protein
MNSLGMSLCSDIILTIASDRLHRRQLRSTLVLSITFLDSSLLLHLLRVAILAWVSTFWKQIERNDNEMSVSRLKLTQLTLGICMYERELMMTCSHFLQRDNKKTTR